jgi:hypothetical protein
VFCALANVSAYWLIDRQRHTNLVACGSFFFRIALRWLMWLWWLYHAVRGHVGVYLGGSMLCGGAEGAQGYTVLSHV